MSNLIKKLFKGSSKGCCDVKIEEVKTEDQIKDNKINSCCRKEAASKKS